MLFPEAKLRFFDGLRAGARSERTVVGYREAIDQFGGHFLAADPSRGLADVQPSDIEAFLAHLRSKGFRPNTIDNRYRSLRAFFRWCRRQGIVGGDLLQGVKHPGIRCYEVAPYSESEVDAMLLATRQNPALALRDQAIIAVLYNTGVRAGEICTLKPDNVREGALLVRGKGDRQRWVGLEATTAQLLGLYLAGREQRRYVFGLSVTGLYQRIRALAHLAGVPNAYVHRFRDTFAVRFLENGGGVDDLQQILGHAGIETTMRYVMWGRRQRAIAAQRKYAPFAVRRGAA